MNDASVIDIDRAAIRHNVRVLRRLTGPGCALCPVVKADAYGLGAVPVARCLAEAGADMLAVYTARQADELLEAGITCPLLALMPIWEMPDRALLSRTISSGQVHCSVHGPAHLDAMARIAEHLDCVIPVHVEVDTGMTRGGCGLADAPLTIRRVAGHDRLQLAGIYTHFAASESDVTQTREQDAAFQHVIDGCMDVIPESCLIHVANTCGTLRCRDWHRSMVRVGQAWAGYGPESVVNGSVMSGAESLRPAVSWRSRIVHLRDVEAGTRVGYGSIWTASRRSRIGLVPVGYADGWPHALGRRADEDPVNVAVFVETPEGRSRRWVPIAGNVSMDQITLDLTDIDERVDVGTPVELIGPDRAAPNHLATIARAAATNPYEILCRLNPRVRRVYRGADAIVETRPSTVTMMHRRPASEIKLSDKRDEPDSHHSMKIGR